MEDASVAVMEGRRLPHGEERSLSREGVDRSGSDRVGASAEGMEIEALYERYGPMVLRRCRKLLGDEERALDAMQEVFVLLLRHERRLRFDRPASLLLRMATNVCLNQLRSISRRRETGEDDLLSLVAPDARVERRTLTGLFLDRLFSRNRETTQAIAVMHWVDGLTLEEVAKEVGLSVSGVRKRLRGLRSEALRLQEMER